ncbi:MAG TPA: hypothetical protein VII21_08445, partial [Aestuariivirga sp.]
MAGFFKKLFNRITGKPNEEAVVEVAAPVALPAPDPEVAPVPEPEVAPVPEPEIVPAPAAVDDKPRPIKAPAKKVLAKKPEAKKPVAKKIAPKVEAKKTPPKKSAPAPKVEIKKAPTPVAKLDSRPRKNDKPVAPAIIAPKTIEPVPPPVAPAVKVTPAPIPVSLPVSAPAPVVEVPQRSGWFSRLKQGLSKSSSSIGGSITSIFTKKKLD